MPASDKPEQISALQPTWDTKKSKDKAKKGFRSNTVRTKAPNKSGHKNKSADKKKRAAE